MARWEPNARDRLAKAALELFSEQGYDTTTVIEIAERAGLTKKTFFRHFADKREVLFFGQENLLHLFTQSVAGAPVSATPIETIAAALDALDPVFGQERRAWVQQRQAVLASNSDLQERELLKLARLTAAVADALRERGVADPTAGLAAELGILAFRTAFTRWVDPANAKTFAELGRQTLDELTAATASLAERHASP